MGTAGQGAESGEEVLCFPILNTRLWNHLPEL